MIVKKDMINEKCCTHYNSNKYFLAYYFMFENSTIIKFPFAYCENCGEASFIGNVIQFYLFRLISYFDSSFKLFVTNEEIEIDRGKKNSGKGL